MKPAVNDAIRLEVLRGDSGRGDCGEDWVGVFTGTADGVVPGEAGPHGGVANVSDCGDGLLWVHAGVGTRRAR